MSSDTVLRSSLVARRDAVGCVARIFAENCRFYGYDAFTVFPNGGIQPHQEWSPSWSQGSSPSKENVIAELGQHRRKSPTMSSCLRVPPNKALPQSLVVMRSMQRSAFESAVLDWIANQTADAPLKQQLEGATISERNHTGAGCYSHLVLADQVPASTASYASRGPLRGPLFESPALEYGGGTLLWFKEGRADVLEIYAHGARFPADHVEIGEFVLSA